MEKDLRKEDPFQSPRNRVIVPNTAHKGLPEAQVHIQFKVSIP